MSYADFMMIRPVAVTDAMLTSTNVPEATVTEYAGGTTYGVGDRRGITVGTVQTVYESLQAANTGNAPASSPTWWRLIGVVYAAYSGATTYALNDIVSSISADVHLLYKSLVAANTGNALADATKWQALGATNARKMFDKAVNSRTSNAESITLVIAPGVQVNSMAILNVVGATVTVSQSISGYSCTKRLISHPVDNLYDFYVEEPIQQTDVVFTDIPPFANAVLTVTISSPGGIAECGLFSMGKSKVIGQTKWGVGAGVKSYSGITTDNFGNVTLVKRDNAKRMSLEARITPGGEDEAYRLLALYTDVEMVFIGIKDWTMTIMYGFMQNWEVKRLSKVESIAPIQVQGLI